MDEETIVINWQDVVAILNDYEQKELSSSFPALIATTFAGRRNNLSVVLRKNLALPQYQTFL